jgi:membrane-bound ClpP family serine protease
MMQNDSDRRKEYVRKVELDRRLVDVGWGVLLTTIGIVWLLPEKHVPAGSWLIAAGLIMLGLNVIRYFNGIQMSSFSLIVGILAMLAGLGEIFSVDMPLLAIALIAIGAWMLLKPLVERNTVSSPRQRWCCCRPDEWESKPGRAPGPGTGR